MQYNKLFTSDNIKKTKLRQKQHSFKFNLISDLISEKFEMLFTFGCS